MQCTSPTVPCAVRPGSVPRQFIWAPTREKADGITVAERNQYLHSHLPTFTFFMGYTRPRLERIDGPHAPGERSNGLNAAYVISEQSLYHPDLLLTFR